jgi:hypothetical protein
MNGSTYLFAPLLKQKKVIAQSRKDLPAEGGRKGFFFAT